MGTRSAKPSSPHFPLDDPTAFPTLSRVKRQTQQDLFGVPEEASMAVGQQGLIIGKARDARLSPAQRTFNRLVRRIEKLRSSISERQARLDGDLAF